MKTKDMHLRRVDALPEKKPHAQNWVRFALQSITDDGWYVMHDYKTEASARCILWRLTHLWPAFEFARRERQVFVRRKPEAK